MGFFSEWIFFFHFVTHNNKQHEIDPIPKAMCILNESISIKFVNIIRLPFLPEHSTLYQSNPLTRLPFKFKKKINFTFYFIDNVCVIYTGHEWFINSNSCTKIRKNTYQKYSYPSHTNIIKRYSPLERISTELSAICVVLVPINTWCVSGMVGRKCLCRCYEKKTGKI